MSNSNNQQRITINKIDIKHVKKYVYQGQAITANKENRKREDEEEYVWDGQLSKNTHTC